MMRGAEDHQAVHLCLNSRRSDVCRPKKTIREWEKKEENAGTIGRRAVWGKAMQYALSIYNFVIRVYT